MNFLTVNEIRSKYGLEPLAENGNCVSRYHALKVIECELVFDAQCMKSGACNQKRKGRLLRPDYDEKTFKDR